MKIKILLLIVFLFNLSCNSSSVKKLEEENKQLKNELELYKSLENNRQKAVSYAQSHLFDLQSERDLLSVLFDTEDFDMKNRAVWSPNFYERLVFPVSYDGFCYTMVEKVLLYRTVQNRAIVVFATYDMGDDGEPQTGRITAPKLSLGFFTQRGDDWELTSFEKNFVYHGAYGEMGDIEIIQIGKNNFALELPSFYLGPQTSYWTTYYPVMDELRPILSIETGHTFHENDVLVSETKTEIILQASDKEYYDIVAITTGISTDEDGETIDVDEEQRFYYDEQAGVYTECKNKKS